VYSVDSGSSCNTNKADVVHKGCVLIARIIFKIPASGILYNDQQMHN